MSTSQNNLTVTPEALVQIDSELLKVLALNRICISFGSKNVTALKVNGSIGHSKYHLCFIA